MKPKPYNAVRAEKRRESGDAFRRKLLADVPQALVALDDDARRAALPPSKLVVSTFEPALLSNPREVPKLLHPQMAKMLADQFSDMNGAP